MSIQGQAAPRYVVRAGAGAGFAVVLLLGLDVQARAAGRRSFADVLRYGPGSVNHPVDVVPSSAVRIPPDWPLDANGTLRCTTCHHTLPSLEGATEYLLRDFDESSAPAVEFCRKCHQDDALSSAAQAHWMAVGTAHVREQPTSTRGSSGSLDAESRKCLGCHDGVTASDHATSPSPGSFHPSWDQRHSHPVGVAYDRGRLGKSGPALRPAALLPQAIRLPDGAVSCVSCHDLYNPTPNRLAVPNEGSQLCLTCHDME